MKKSLLIFVISLVSILTWGQSKGDIYVSLTGVASLGKDYTATTLNGVVTKDSAPGTTSLAIQGEVAYFVADNWRVSLGFGVPYTSTRKGKDSHDKWLYDTVKGLQVAPSISRYFRLTDCLYYTPEIGGAYEFGKMSEEVTSGTGYTRDYTGWALYACFLAFEFKVGNKISLGVGLGDVSYVSARTSYAIGTGDLIAESGELKFNFNVSQIAFRYYFR